MSSLNTCYDTSSSDDSECGPLWDSTDDSDSDNYPPKKKVKNLNKDISEEGGENGAAVSALLAGNSHEAITVTVDGDGTAHSRLFSNEGAAELCLQDEDLTAAGEGEEDDEDDVDDREPYEVRRFSNLRDVITYMDHYQQETMTHFTSFSRHGYFGEEKRIPNVQRGRIYFESLKGKCGMPIAYDGVPFIHVGRWSFGCHQGIDRNMKQKQQYHQKRKEKCKKEGIKLETRQRTSKKVNCPAEIYISHVVKFPQHEVSQSMVAENCLPSDQVRRSIKRKLSEQYKQNHVSIVCQHWYYVRIPHAWAHKGHPVLATISNTTESAEELVPSGTKVTLNAEAVARMYDKRKTSGEKVVIRTKEPVDGRVLDKIRELYKTGVQQEKDIRDCVAHYVKDELFAGKTQPPNIFRRFNPTHKDIANEITKAREELRVERLCEQRQVCSSFVSEIARLIPAVDEQETLDELQGQLQQLYELLKNSVPACVCPEDNVITETTIIEKEDSTSTCGSILLSEEAAIVIPQTIVHQQQRHHQQQQQQQQQHHHQQQQHQHHQLHPTQQQQQLQLGHPNSQLVHQGTTVLASTQQQHITIQTQPTITYQNYTVHPISTLNTMTGVGSLTHTISPVTHTIIPGTITAAINTINGQQQTYGIANLQPQSSGQFETNFGDGKFTSAAPW
uniref:Calcium-responsive transcription factor-like n=1 Tax=Hirondellea gigas TaxID=1518452 RepID=A0A2P2IC99_9CRUS